MITESQFRELKNKLKLLEENAPNLSESVLMSDHFFLIKASEYDDADPWWFISEAGNEERAIEDSRHAYYTEVLEMGASEDEARENLENEKFEVVDFTFIDAGSKVFLVEVNHDDGNPDDVLYYVVNSINEEQAMKEVHGAIYNTALSQGASEDEAEDTVNSAEFEFHEVILID